MAEVSKAETAKPVEEFGLVKCVTPTIMSGEVVRWKEAAAANGLEISASRDGVMIHGCSSAMSGLRVRDIIRCLEEACKEHDRLKNKGVWPK